MKIPEFPTEKIQTESNFSTVIEDMVLSNNDMTYLEAITIYSEREGIEPQTVAKIIGRPLKEKLAAEAIDLNLLKKKKKVGKFPI